MTAGPDPAEIFERAASEGQRRLDQSALELVSTGFIAGFTIVFGIIALGIVEAAFHQEFETLAKLAGAVAFGIGLVFLVIGKAELFSENFFDPIAAVIKADGWHIGRLLRLWSVTVVLNLVGGGIFVAILTLEGALPRGTTDVLVRFSEEVVRRSQTVEFVRAFTGGALVALLSFLLQAVDQVSSRIFLSYAVGVMLAMGPFDHVVVTILHLLFGVFLGANIGGLAIAETTAIVTAGNIVGGIGLVTLTHIGQAIGAGKSIN